MKTVPCEIVKEYRIPSGSAIDKLSRYNIYKRLVNTEGDNYIETPERREIKESAKDSFYSVEKGYENRIDLISYRFYGTPLLWWAIAVMNKIQDPMDVKAGIVLRIPTLRSIYESGSLNTDA